MSDSAATNPCNFGDSGGPEAARVIITTRVFPFARETVFLAFSEPDHLARWWGPEGFSSTFQEFDFQAGGWWRFVMHGPDGTDYPNESVFTEIHRPEQLVFEHQGGHWFRATFLFEEVTAGGGHDGEAGKPATQLTFRQLFGSAAHCDAIREFVTAANEQNFDRLGAELTRMV